LKTGDRKKGGEESARRCHCPDKKSIDQEIAPKDNTNRSKKETQQVKEYKGMEIPNDILFFKPPKKQLEEQERKGEDNPVNFHIRPFPNAIDGIDGDIPDSELIDVQFYQDVIGHPVAFINAVKIESLQDLQGNRGVA
jgi:hypothetical protein